MVRCCKIDLKVVYYLIVYKGGIHMTNSLVVAKYLNDLYFSKYDCCMDQMKMHKMMYFIQRESLITNDTILFNEDFEAWKFGPVLPKIRREYRTGHMFCSVQGIPSNTEIQIIEKVFNYYDRYSAWSLSTLSHAEGSWIQARRGLQPGENGNRKMLLSAIRVDATKEKLRRQGVVFARIDY